MDKNGGAENFSIDKNSSFPQISVIENNLEDINNKYPHADNNIVINSSNENGSIYVLDYKENTKQFLRHQEKSIDYIIDNIYIGDVLFSLDKEALKIYNITHILVCGKEIEAVYPGEFIYKHIPLYDSDYTNISKYFDECNQFIKDSNADNKKIESSSSPRKNLFVHCGAGMSRSVSMVLAYLIGELGYGYGEALELIKSRRKIARPNQGFEKQLRNYSYEKNKKF